MAAEPAQILLVIYQALGIKGKTLVYSAFWTAYLIRPGSHA